MLAPWVPSNKHLKQYPHFDAPLRLDELENIANDPDAVASNKFYPFLLYKSTFKPFRPKGEDLKIRDIRYGTRRDAAIFSRYRYGLSELYERELEKRELSGCVIAYRHIPVTPTTETGKCNIHHAHEAFEAIKSLGNCCAIVMDISSYFENLDHKRIKSEWKKLLGVGELPHDHYAVFKAVTQYRVIDCKLAYEALGYFGIKDSGIPGYLKPKAEMPKQLCSPQEFRDKICGDAPGYKNLVQKNKNKYGIPQGAPLSDLIANFHLIDFDEEINALASSMGGFYRRYSDDILIVIPGDAADAQKTMNHVKSRISSYGTKLEIKDRKCSVHKFVRSDSGLNHIHIYPTTRMRGLRPTPVTSNGLSYLGFRFDGQKVFLKDGTLSNFWRKVSARIRREAVHLVTRYPGKDILFLESQFDVEGILEKVGRVRDFRPVDDKRTWTFWTYVTRAVQVFGDSSYIHHQLRNYRNKIRNKAAARLSKAYFNSL